MSPSKDETAVRGCYCWVDMAVPYRACAWYWPYREVGSVCFSSYCGHVICPQARLEIVQRLMLNKGRSMLLFN